MRCGEVEVEHLDFPEKSGRAGIKELLGADMPVDEGGQSL
jgi:hypothetical protein